MCISEKKTGQPKRRLGSVKNCKALFCCILVAALVALSSCGDATIDNGGETTAPPSEYAGLYQPQYVAWPAAYASMREVVVGGSSAYAIVNCEGGFALERVSLPGGEITTLATAINEQTANGSIIRNITALCAVKGGVWYSDITITQNTAEPFPTSENLYQLVHVDDDGTEVARIDISKARGLDPVYAIAADDNGNAAFINSNNQLFAFDKNGVQLFSDKAVGSSWLVRSAGGDVYLHERLDVAPETTTLTPVDFKAKKLGKEIDITACNPWWLSSGYGDADFYYTDNDGIYALSLKDNESQLVLSFTRHTIDSYSVDYVSVDANGDIFALETSRATSGIRLYPLYLQAVENIDFDPDNPETFPPIMREKIQLTYGAAFAGSVVRNMIASFNRTNQEVFINILDYTEMTDGDIQAAIDMMMLDLTAGKLPDIIDLSMLRIPRENWGTLVRDLYPFLDSDPEYSRESFIPSILSVLDHNGTLPRLALGFSIDTLVGKQSIFGTELGWSFEDMRQMEAQLPQETYLVGDMTGSLLFNQMIFMSHDRFVSEDGTTCSFDSDEFISMLEWCASLPENTKYTSDSDIKSQELGSMMDEDLQNEVILLSRATLSTPRAVRMFKEAFGEEVSFIGYPGSVYGASVHTNITFSISTTCKNPEAAWEFIRFSLGYDGESLREIPTLVTKLEAMLEAEMSPVAPRADGSYHFSQIYRRVGYNYVYYTVGARPGTPGYERYPLSEEEVRQFMDVVNAVVAWEYLDYGVLSIVYDSLPSFFEGAKTARETAEIIQNRVSTLLAERS